MCTLCEPLRSLVRPTLAIGLVSLAVASPLLAQEVQIVTDPILTALGQQIELLDARVQQLEERLNKPMTVTAPFTVKGPGGQSFLVVDAATGLTLGDVTSPAFQVREVGNSVELTLDKGGAVVHVAANAAGTSTLDVTGTGAHMVRIASTGAASGVEARAGDTSNDYAQVVFRPATGAGFFMHRAGQRAAEISASEGAQATLRLFDPQGKVAITAGSDAAGPRLRVGDASEPAFEVKDLANSSEVTISKGQAVVHIATNAAGSGTLDVTGNGAHLVRIASTTASSGVEARAGDASDDYAQLALRPGTGAGLFLRRSGKRTAELSYDEGGAAGLRVYDAESNVAAYAQDDGIGLMKAGSPAIGLAASDAGEGLLSVYTATHLGAELGRAEDSPGPVLRLYDAAGDPAVEASVDPSGSSLIIAKQGEPGAVMSVSGDGKGAFDVLSGADKLASLNGASGTGSLLLQDGAGSLGSWLGVLPGGVGFMELYRGDTRAVQIGPSDTNTNAALRIFGGDNGNVAMGIASNGLPAVRVTDGGGRVLAAMEAVDGSRGAITVQAENGLAAGLGIDQRGEGIVAVYNGTPTPVAFLTTSSGGDGGNVTTALNDGFGVFSAGAAQDGGGEACVNRRTQAGTERLGCLNLGLPSAGMGK